MRTSRRITVALATAALTVTGLLAFGGSTPAQAIPTLAQACFNNATTVAGGSGWQLMNDPIWINNSQGFRRTVINVSADADVDHHARIVIAYRIDPTGFLQNPGARFFATWSESMQTRHSMVVMPVGAGWHRVYVYWAVAGPSSSSGTIAGRCMTVEGDTK